MNLEVEMYVRTKRDYIYKLSYYEEEEKRWICVEEDDWYPVYESDVIKASNSIIDLVQVGDYVNGIKVDVIENSQLFNYNSYDGWKVNITPIDNETISIVTKEQFESMSYKVEREEN